MDTAAGTRRGLFLPGVAILGFLAVLGFTCYYAMGTNVFGQRPWPEGCVDYHIIYEASHQVVETTRYRPKHAYPPSAISLHYLLAQLPFSASAAVFMALTIVSTLACGWLLLRFVPDSKRSGWLMLVLPSFLLAQGALVWDLRSQNCNLIFCACALAAVYALHRNRPLATGFWLALSFSVKLFSLFLIPYLLWRRNIRALGWTLAFLVFFWGAVPLGVFGPEGLLAIYPEWWKEMQSVAADSADLTHAIVISLHNADQLIFGPAGNGIASFTNGFRLGWLLVGLATMGLSWRWRRQQGNAHGLLADVSLLVLGPVALSPYLEPYHGVWVIVPGFLLLEVLTDRRQSIWLRGFAAIALGAVLFARQGLVPFAYRGLVVNAGLITAVASALVVTALRRGRDVDSSASGIANSPSEPILALRRKAG